MSIIDSKNKGGQQVWEFPDGRIVPLVVLVSESGNIISPSGTIATADKQDDIVSSIDALLTGVVLAPGSNVIGSVQLADPNDSARLAEFDAKFKIPITISVEHHEIHEGDHFFYSDCVTLGNGATQDYLLTVPNNSDKRIHFTFNVTSGFGITLAFYEGADRTGTTGQTVYNNDRDSSNSATLTIHKGTSGGSTDGTDIHPDCSGSASVGGNAGIVERHSELLLKTNTKYILRVTSGAANNDIATHLDWYEHTNE